MTYEGPERRVSSPTTEITELRRATKELTTQVRDLTSALSKLGELEKAQGNLEVRQEELESSTPSREEVKTGQSKDRREIRRRVIATVMVLLTMGAGLGLVLLIYTRSVGVASYNDCAVANKNRLLFRQYMQERADGGDEAAKTVIKN